MVVCCSSGGALLQNGSISWLLTFDRRLRNLGITRIRTPFGPLQANAIAERRVRSARAEGLDYTRVFNARHLRRVLAAYFAYFNHWRPHRSRGQRASCAPATSTPRPDASKVIAKPVLGGLHHVYQVAA